MSRDLFLKKLYRSLKWQTSLSETKIIVLEYCELFDKERSMGKSEWEICEELGTPMRTAYNAISARAYLDRRPALYKILFFMGTILLLLFPLLSLYNAVYRALWYVYILLAPPAVLALFRLQHVWKIPFSKTPTVTYIFYGTAGLSLMICVACSFAMYDIITHYATIQPQDGPMLHAFLVAFIWLIAGMWILSALFCDACGYYFPYTHFLYAFCIATLSSYEESISCMSLPSLEALLISTFKPLPIFALLAIAGALLWLVYVRYKKRANTGIR